jgi:hypothetical protein
MLSLSACATGSSEGLSRVCPPVVEYGNVEQNLAAAEVEELPEGAVVVRMLSDYAMIRDQVRACSG